MDGFDGNAALKRRQHKRSCWRAVGCPHCRPHACALVLGLAWVLPAWLWGLQPCRVRHRLGRLVWRHTALASSGVCCLLLQCAQFCCAFTKVEVVLDISRSNLLRCDSNKMSEKSMSYVQCPQSWLPPNSLVPVCENLLLQKIVRILPLAFLVKQGFLWKYFPVASNRIVLIGCIPVRQTFVSSSKLSPRRVSFHILKDQWEQEKESMRRRIPAED